MVAVEGYASQQIVIASTSSFDDLIKSSSRITQSMAFSLGLHLTLFPFIFLVVLMPSTTPPPRFPPPTHNLSFSSLFKNLLCLLNFDCYFLIYLIRFFSSSGVC